MPEINSTDIIAILVIIGCFTLIYTGKNGVLYSILLTTVAYYFGKKTSKLIVERKHE